MNASLENSDVVADWTLVGDDWALLGNKAGATRLAFALMLKHFDRQAQFPQSLSDFPAGAVDYVASQVKTDVSALADYEWSDRTSRRHRAQIRSVFGFREISRGDEPKVVDWLAREVCPLELGNEQLREAVLLRGAVLRVRLTVSQTQQVVPPTSSLAYGHRPGCPGQPRGPRYTSLTCLNAEP